MLFETPFALVACCSKRIECTPVWILCLAIVSLNIHYQVWYRSIGLGGNGNFYRVCGVLVGEYVVTGNLYQLGVCSLFW